MQTYNERDKDKYISHKDIAAYLGMTSASFSYYANGFYEFIPVSKDPENNTRLYHKHDIPKYRILITHMKDNAITLGQMQELDCQQLSKQLF